MLFRSPTSIETKKLHCLASEILRFCLNYLINTAEPLVVFYAIRATDHNDVIHHTSKLFDYLVSSNTILFSISHINKLYRHLFLFANLFELSATTTSSIYHTASECPKQRHLIMRAFHGTWVSLMLIAIPQTQWAKLKPSRL